MQQERRRERGICSLLSRESKIPPTSMPLLRGAGGERIITGKYYTPGLISLSLSLSPPCQLAAVRLRERERAYVAIKQASTSLS
jgi:hypothetical protein